MLARKRISKKKWRKELKETFEVIISNVFRHREIKDSIRVIIAEFPLDRRFYLTEGGKTVNQEGRTYKVYVVQKEDATEIYFFERNMSKVNANKKLLLEIDQNMDDNDKEFYYKSIAYFLLANVV